MPYAKSKHIDLAKQLKDEKPVPFALYPLTQLAENLRRILNDDTYIDIVEALHLFGIRKMDLSEFPGAELKGALDEKTNRGEHVSEDRGGHKSKTVGR